MKDQEGCGLRWFLEGLQKEMNEREQGGMVVCRDCNKTAHRRNCWRVNDDKFQCDDCGWNAFHDRMDKHLKAINYGLKSK